MTFAKVLRWEGLGFLYLLAGMVVFKLLTRGISTGGLLARPGSRAASPERVQLLLATVALSLRYAGQVAHSSGGAMPDVDRSWLYLFGGSSGVYAASKAALAVRSRMAQRRPGGRTGT